MLYKPLCFGLFEQLAYMFLNIAVYFGFMIISQCKIGHDL